MRRIAVQWIGRCGGPESGRLDSDASPFARAMHRARRTHRAQATRIPLAPAARPAGRAAGGQDAAPAPVTAVYSRRDGVVSWRACIDSLNPGVEHVEVSSTHAGLGFQPEVLAIVARRLAG